MDQAVEIAEVSVAIFAGLREAVGTESLHCRIPLPCSAEAFKREIAGQYPVISRLVLASRLAIEHTFVEEQAHVELSSVSGKRVALIPPVSGG